ncbi:cobalamin-dependent protein [Nannocystis sp. SCPEA4]|uniref:cobalamin B12-binding domain-containing protein n=1 Tax=Nannocystis sp. SCPEA4 TaxID=2996787 RepID=UPI00226FF7D7|nr:cobalamin-dependent protein [Nannocystis sp. SCPEA4]MCY1059986.1 cobalamin-dependent protein [Nannocystis sp. SCPEA4]
MAGALGTVLERYLTAQLGGDPRAALGVIDEALAQGHAVRTLQREVVQAAQREIGRRWQENRLSIAHEHMATAISQRVLMHLFERAPRAPARGVTILVACVEGELHELPARLVADYLELGGFSVRYLGASVPTDSLVAIVAEAPPAALALSATMAFHAPALRAAVEAVRGRFPALPILAGGQLLGWLPRLGAELGVLVAGDDPDELLMAVERAVKIGHDSGSANEAGERGRRHAMR